MIRTPDCQRREAGRFDSSGFPDPFEQDLNLGDAVADVEGGDDSAINFLVGQVMGKTGGSADPGEVNRLLREEVEE